jgi:riboflavin synthase
MFTGIISNQATIKTIQQQCNSDLLLEIEIHNYSQTLNIGCSIACNGICLTLIKQNNNSLYFQASQETINKTTIATWQKGDIINIEFSLKMGDELGGHLVLGHIDTTTSILKIESIKQSWLFVFANQASIAPFISPKGSISINGISLTINDVFDDSFAINVIPHTFLHTNMQFLKIGNIVNIEIDPMARYVGNYLKFSHDNQK